MQQDSVGRKLIFLRDIPENREFLSLKLAAEGEKFNIIRPQLVISLKGCFGAFINVNRRGSAAGAASQPVAAARLPPIARTHVLHSIQTNRWFKKLF